MNKVDVLSRISDEMRKALESRPPLPAQTNYPADPLACMRASYNLDRQYWNQGGPVMVATQEVQIPFNGETVRARIHYPSDANCLPVLFYIHGGGFVVGNLDTHDRIMRLLAAESGAAVIGIEYSLSPEEKFPQAIQECVAVSQYFQRHARDYRLDETNMGYAGDSAGAHLCLASYLWQRDKGMNTDHIKALLLYYGLYGLKDSRSQRLYGGEWDGLTAEDLCYYRQMYLSSPSEAESRYYCLLNNDLVRNMPACFIASSEFDPLLDDSETLASMLTENHIPNQYQMYPGTLHAFLHYSKALPIAKQAISDGARYFVSRLSA